MADGEQFSLDLFDGIAARNQLRYADAILLNKCDRVDAERLGMVEEKIRRLMRRRGLCARRAAPFRFPSSSTSICSDPRTAGPRSCSSGRVTASSRCPSRATGPSRSARFQAFLDAGRPPGLFRGKGFLWLAETGKRYVFHLVGERFTLEEDERGLRRRQPPGADRTGPRCGNPASAPGGLPRPRLAAAPLLDVGGIGVAGGGDQGGGEERRLCAVRPAPTLSRVSAGVSTKRRLAAGSSKPATRRSAGMPASAKLAWSELVISGRTVRSVEAVGLGDAAAGTARRRHSRCVSAARLGLPATESRLTLSAILPRSAALRLSTYCAEPVSAHSSTLKNITRRPRRKPATCGASARVDGQHRGEPAAVVHGALGEVVAVDMGAEHDPFVGRAGIIVQQRLGLGRPPPRSRWSGSPSASRAPARAAAPPSRARCRAPECRSPLCAAR